MIHADHALARRLEALICAELRTLAVARRTALPDTDPDAGARGGPRAGATCAEVAGGVALWLGPGSPMNVAVGLGMDGPVTDADLEEVEEFYFSREAESVVTVCPLADESLWDVLGRRGYVVTEFEHVLARELRERRGGRQNRRRGPGVLGVAATADCFATSLAEAPPGVVVRACTAEERELWSRLVARGFADGGPPGQADLEVGAVMAARENAVLVMAWVDGEPAGTGALVIDGGAGWLSADTTLPQFRRRGVQQAVQTYRLQLARQAGCDLAVTESAPGSASQRNMERLGFRIVFTHVEFVRPPS